MDFGHNNKSPHDLLCGIFVVKISNTLLCALSHEDSGLPD